MVGAEADFSASVSHRGKKTRFYFLLALFPILLLIETQIVAEETARQLITVLCNEATGRRRPRSDRCEQHPAAPDIKANTDI